MEKIFIKNITFNTDSMTTTIAYQNFLVNEDGIGLTLKDEGTWDVPGELTNDEVAAYAKSNIEKDWQGEVEFALPASSATSPDVGKDATPPSPGMPGSDGISGNGDVKVGLEITQLPTKLEYAINEPIDLTGIIISQVNEDGSQTVQEIISGDMVTGFDSSAANPEETITITMGEESVSFAISIK